MGVTQHKHPEGLPFPPEGNGWTEVREVPSVGSRVRLLTEHNIVAVKRNNEVAWTAAFDALPGQKRDRRGLVTGLSDDERRRLATLTVLIQKGVVMDEPVT